MEQFGTGYRRKRAAMLLAQIAAPLVYLAFKRSSERADSAAAGGLNSANISDLVYTHPGTRSKPLKAKDTSSMVGWEEVAEEHAKVLAHASLRRPRWVLKTPDRHQNQFERVVSSMVLEHVSRISGAMHANSRTGPVRQEFGVEFIHFPQMNALRMTTTLMCMSFGLLASHSTYHEVSEDAGGVIMPKAARIK